jgi:predicted dehydrogenase/threonine dehydrogenase-like Zn-dependent dehydrogenase
MKQVLQSQHGGSVRVEEVPIPTLRSGGVLVRTSWSLVSTGTERAKVELAQKSLLGKARARPQQFQQVLSSLRDQGILDTYRKVTNRLESLQPLGYSCSGVVLAVGNGAEEFRVGDLVTCSGAGYANHAEVVFVPKNLCARIPGFLGPVDTQPVEPSGLETKLSLEEAAFVTPGAIALHGVRQADTRLDEAVAVVGLGLIGLLTVQILKCGGCRVFGMDLDPRRCELARSLGCDVAESEANRFVEAVQRGTQARGVDATILTAATPSSEPINLASRLSRDRGRVVVVGDVGMDVQRSGYYEKELELRICRSYGPGRYDPAYEEKGHDYPLGYVRWTEKRNFETFLRLVTEGKVRVTPLITHRFPVERAADAYQMIAGGSQYHLGVLLQYGDVADGNRIEDFETTLRQTSRVIVRKSSARRSCIGVGLIGAGNFAQDVLIPALRSHKDVHLRGVATASGLSARSAAERFGFEYCASDSREILQDPQIDAVVIATRHDQHARLVIEALRHSKAIFVEKPLALNLDQLNDIVDAYQECEASAPSTSSLLMVGFNRRFSPAVCAVRQFFGDTGPLSLHYRINAGYLAPQHWLQDPEVGGGRFIGEGCHFVDVLIYLANSEIVEVRGHELATNGQARQENIVAELRFANGSLGVLQYLSSGDKRLGKERIEVLGGGATAVVDDFRRTTLSRGGRTNHFPRWLERQDKGHRDEITAFLRAVKTGAPSPIPFRDLVLSTQVTFKIVESAQIGGSVPIHGCDVGVSNTIEIEPPSRVG